MKNSRVTLIALTTLASFVIAGFFYFQPSQAQTAVVTTIPGKFYKLDVMATNTSLGVASLFAGPSLNDNGDVAFSGTNNLYTADGVNTVRIVRSGTYDSSVQINNNNLLIARNNPSQTTQFLYRFDTSLATPSQTVIAGLGATGFNDFTSIYSHPSINNNGQPAFSALNGVNPLLVTNLRTTFNNIVIAGSGTNLRPMIADNGNVIVRAGATNTSPIRLYNYALTAPFEIANSTNFSELGQSPGISDDGEVIVFYGNLTASGATALQTNAGPGIFASIVNGTTRRTIRIAGRQVENINVAVAPFGNLDGICDPGEQCIAGELGFATSGGASTPITFSSFDPNSRIGVVHRVDEGAAGIADDTFIVTFLGTPSSASNAPQYFSNQLGLWTIRVEMKTESGNLREKPFRAAPVIQVGDNLGTTTRQVTGIGIYDPIALAATDDQGVSRTQRKPDHRLVFQATTNNGGTTGSAIVRASSFDSDEDGLADHWERSGIDFNQDGTVDLALNNPLEPGQTAANPNRKDIFIEMDYMQETAGANPHTHQPGRRPDNSANLTVDPILRVRNSFASAPNRNPDGSTGITLHTFVGEALPETYAIQFQYQNRPTGAADDFDDFKFGSNGTAAGVPCGTGANDGHFGTVADRGSANCNNILGAKRLVFRYSIFAHRVVFPPDPIDETSGVAELFGNDFIVSLAVREPSVTDWEDYANSLVGAFNSTTPTPVPALTFDDVFADIQAGTFMHELGHTLGLLHGGKDPINCKPNYLSLMSYSRQSNNMGRATIDLPGTPPNSLVLSNRKLDYSRRPVLRTLTEAALLETAGINGPSGERTLHGSQSNGSTLISAADGRIDWNNNAMHELTAIAADVNWLPSVSGACVANPNQIPPQTTPIPNQTLESSDDWTNLRFNFIDTINFADGTSRVALLDGKDINVVDALNGGLGSKDVEADGVLNTNDNCMFAPNSDQADSNGNGIGNVCDPATTALADLRLSIAESADPVQINTSFNYIATVRNNGSATAQNVTFNNQLPANVTFVSVTSSQGSCSGTSNIVCNLGTLIANASATITIRVTPTTLGRLDNYASVSNGVNDPNVLNNRNSASTAITDSSVTYTISGRVSDENGAGLSNAAIILNGSQITVTDSNGDYSTAVAGGGIYTVTATRSGYDFSMSGRTVAYINANTTVNLVGIQTGGPTAAEVTISGKVMTSSGGDINNATVKLIDGNGVTRSASTNASGNYQFADVAAGQTYTMTATHSYFSFDPKVVNVTGDMTELNFIATGSASYASDLVVWRMQDGTWYVRDAQNPSAPTQAQTWGMAGDKPAPADFNGDGLYDFCVFRPNSPSQGVGTWYIQYNGSANMLSYQFGTDTDRPVPADFDGDLKADIAVWRNSTSSFYILRSSDNVFLTQTVAQGGEPVPADFDGDGKADAATFNRSTAVWSIIQSSDNTTRTAQFGAANDEPVKGDFDGDGKFDLAVRRGSNNNWYILQSSTNQTTTVYWGVATDTLVPGDYDADGKTDIAVWRSGNGYWFILQSSKLGQPDEMRAEQWGASTDIPIPAPFRQ